MADGIVKSFRIKETGLRTLDSLRDYFSDVNRSDICAAAIHIYAESDDRNDSHKKEDARPFDFCADPIRSILNESYRVGRTTTNIRIIFGENLIDISKFTQIKCSGLSSAVFYLTNKTTVTLDLASDIRAELAKDTGREILKIYLSEEDTIVQNRETGRIANRIGRYIAGKIAESLGTELISENSNECEYDGSRCVIKTARSGNNLFGITKRMHERLDNVLLAVESKLNNFDVYIIEMETLLSRCATTGENSGKGKVTSYAVYDAISLGKKIRTVEIDLSEFDPIPDGST